MNVLARNNITIKGNGKTPMLFAHGFGCDQNMWRFLPQRLKTLIKLFYLIMSARENLT